ncbi:hypothetical protein PQX77_017713 [Marasmius sp. AFHP31]|nr:hypothetical protein PQX77_017713 [Marasmius sp. AFHP31]
MPRTRCRPPPKIPTVTTKTLAAATNTLSVAAKRKTKSIETQYRSRRRRKASSKDTEGYIYVLEGRYKRKRFLKVGRSVDSDRRFQQHQRTCKRVKWTQLGTWDALKSHKAEACIHLKMRCVGFTKLRMVCCCRKKHEEWFEYKETTFSQAQGLASSIISKLHNAVVNGM